MKIYALTRFVHKCSQWYDSAVKKKAVFYQLINGYTQNLVCPYDRILYGSALKRNEVMTPATTTMWMDFKIFNAE